MLKHIDELQDLHDRVKSLESADAKKKEKKKAAKKVDAKAKKKVKNKKKSSKPSKSSSKVKETKKDKPDAKETKVIAIKPQKEEPVEKQENLRKTGTDIVYGEVENAKVSTSVTAREAIVAIGGMDSVNIIQQYIEGESRVTVLAKAENRIRVISS